MPQKSCPGLFKRSSAGLALVLVSKHVVAFGCLKYQGGEVSHELRNQITHAGTGRWDRPEATPEVFLEVGDSDA